MNAARQPVTVLCSFTEPVSRQAVAASLQMYCALHSSLQAVLVISASHLMTIYFLEYSVMIWRTAERQNSQTLLVSWTASMEFCRVGTRDTEGRWGTVTATLYWRASMYFCVFWWFWWHSVGYLLIMMLCICEVPQIGTGRPWGRSKWNCVDTWNVKWWQKNVLVNWVNYVTM